MGKAGPKERWLNQWHTPGRSAELLQDWDQGWHVLLASHDASAEEIVPKVIEGIKGVRNFLGVVRRKSLSGKGLSTRGARVQVGRAGSVKFEV